MITYPDGSQGPDHNAEKAVLADLTDPRARTGHGYEHNRVLGDLIVDLLAGRWVTEDAEEHPEDWESIEHAFLQRTALELRALNHAIASKLTTDDPPCDEFTDEDACEMVRGLARRLETGAELCRRLRDARWGHPSFGGGEKLAEWVRIRREQQRHKTENGSP